MKKILLATIVAIAAISGIIGYSNETTNQKLNALALANVEALSSGEGQDLVGSCNLWCRDFAGQTCTLMTNYGFPINCHDMTRN